MARVGAQSIQTVASKHSLASSAKRGDIYLRTLLIHGARAVIRYAEKKAKPESWLRKLMARRNKNAAAICPGEQEFSHYLGITCQTRSSALISTIE